MYFYSTGLLCIFYILLLLFIKKIKYMNIYPKDSALLKIEDYNTYFKIRAS